MQHRGYEYVCMGVGLCVIHVCVWAYVIHVCMGVFVYGCICYTSVGVCVWVYLKMCVYGCMCMGTNPDMHVIKIYGNPF